MRVRTERDRTWARPARGRVGPALGLVLAGLAVGSPAPLVAQVEIELAPHVGLFLPGGGRRPFPQPADGGPHLRRDLPAVLLGVRAIVPVARHVALEGAGAYSPVVTAVTDGTSTRDLEGTTLLGSIRARLAFNPAVGAGRWVFYGLAGAGVWGRSGRAWRGFHGTTDAALLLGTGMALRPPGSPLALRLEIEDYISWRDDRGKAAPAVRWLSHGIAWSMGVSFTVAR